MTEKSKIISEIESKFIELFHHEPELYQAPGRINLIGEHTDYNDGFVLPAAIDKAIYFGVKKNKVNKLRLFSIDYKESFEISMDELEKTQVHWANYLIGVAVQFNKRGLKPEGIDCVFGGNIPLGAGLSSSAALECGFAVCLNDQFSYKIPNSELILMAQKAEHEFAGVMCGIMDQFASIFGKEGHVMKLDCRSLDYEYFPLTNNEVDVILCDTRVSHSLASSEYNVRRKECEEGVAILKKQYPEVNALRDASPEMLESVRSGMSENVYLRSHYVVHEVVRVNEACEALLKNDFVTFGQRMYATHDGLSKEYLVSCKELDILVEIARKNPDVLGARMMGGGFGGCTINLIRKGCTEPFIQEVLKEYPAQTGINPIIYRVKISDGAGRLI
ncbi:MAG: galactokinase [Bacteroidales bacterium]|nr:galactokinase [Bacteroidales bacterium]